MGFFGLYGIVDNSSERRAVGRSCASPPHRALGRIHIIYILFAMP